MRQLLLYVERSSHLLETRYQLGITPIEGSYQRFIPNQKAYPAVQPQEPIDSNQISIDYVYCTQDKKAWQVESMMERVSLCVVQHPRQRLQQQLAARLNIVRQISGLLVYFRHTP
jgi:hypothetical protein